MSRLFTDLKQEACVSCALRLEQEETTKAKFTVRIKRYFGAV